MNSSARRTSLLSLTALLSLAVACGSPDDCRSLDCSQEASDCTLAQTASQAGFWVGAAVPGDVSDPRMEAVVTHFNSITAENAMKWGELAPRVGDYDFGQADALVDFAHANGLRLRGHTLVWGKFPGHGYPAELRDLMAQASEPADLMREILAEHIRTVVGRYAGRVASWDVVNEPLALLGPALELNVFSEALGADYIAEAFHTAHAADPEAMLFLNENLLSYTDAKARAFVELVAGLLDDGVPVHGVGIQAHLFLSVPPPEDFRAYLEELADLGVTVELTEVDVAKAAIRSWEDTERPIFDAQADVYRSLVAACLALPGCRGATFWGIDDEHTWLDSFGLSAADAPNEPLLLDMQLRPKPAYFALRDVIAERIAN